VDFPPGHIFLTGGTGFFGKCILECWASSAARARRTSALTVLSRDPGRFLAEFPQYAGLAGLTFVRGDIRDFASPPGEFDYIVHAAAEVVNPSPEAVRSIIVGGTERVLRMAEEKAVQRLLYVSSGAVYGPQPPEVSHLPETFVCRPQTDYGRSKYEAEQLCRQAGTACLIARGFAFVGPYLPLSAHFAIGNFIRDSLAGAPIHINGDGRPLRTYMYGDDLVDWLMRILVAGTPGEAYNVGSDQALSILELARRVCAIAGSRNEIMVACQADEHVPAPRYVPCVRKACETLGLSLRYSLDEAIRLTLTAHRTYPDRDC
jgi:dTDP-glucose 4,6-dehydratase